MGGCLQKPTCSLFSSGPFSVGLANLSHLQTLRIASSFSSSNSPRSLLLLLDISKRQLLPHWFKTYAMESKEEEEEEYVLLDLDSVSSHFEIPPNAPYSFSGLNTEHPVLTIGDKLKLIGEYQETIGTCLIFKEEDASPGVHEETGPSEANLFAGKCIMDPNQSPSKQVKPVTSLQKILKFRLAPNLESHVPPEQSRDPVLHTVSL
ncbi:hypothetical protein ACFX13_031497 [Malus domestica]|uniref:Transcription factor TFIIIC triple barrel domain-containing protein n=2 Tax=Malus domestica TaxID=3750 RepID=A0A498K6C2_MALDO|nr:hypothetical protein DVH24_003169 [Malus domestica]